MKIFIAVMFILLFLFTALMIAVLINDAEIEEFEQKLFEKKNKGS